MDIIGRLCEEIRKKSGKGLKRKIEMRGWKRLKV